MEAAAQEKLTLSVQLMGEFNSSMLQTRQAQGRVSDIQKKLGVAKTKRNDAMQRVVECKLELARAGEALAGAQMMVATSTKKLARADLESLTLDDQVIKLEVELQKSIDESNSLQNFQFEACAKVASHNCGMTSSFGSRDIRTAARVAKQAEVAMHSAMEKVKHARDVIKESDMPLQTVQSVSIQVLECFLLILFFSLGPSGS